MMRLVNAPEGVEATEFASRAEALLVPKAGELVIALHESAVGIRSYCVLRFVPPDGSSPWVVRVVVQGTGVPPQAVFVDGTLLLGYDASYAVIDVGARRLSHTGSLNGAFFDFVPGADPATMLVVHEIGILALDWKSGRVRWRFDCDIISRVSVDGDRLSVFQFDGPSAVLSMFDGQLVR